ncbi:MAG: DUF2877 domain-containing protein [Chloroflexi bacterium]|nr:DUF2877 domain-containing protein [Chloroflexota bacterium]
MASPAHRVHVARMAPRARNWLEQTQQAYVLYAFERVVNLVNQEGDVLSLVSHQIGAGPFSLVLESGIFPGGIQLGASLLVFENGFWLDDWLIDAEEAESWNPIPNWQAVVKQKEKKRWAARIIREQLTQHAEADSLACLVLDPVANSPLPARILQAAEQNIPLLFSSFRQNNLALVSKAAKSLAGMGPGLTPAGDDLLLGALHGIWATRPLNEAQELGGAISRSAAPRTHALSAAWLEAGAAGEAAEPWHALIDAISDQDEATLKDAVMRILPTGHTSGSDALGGFLGVIEGKPV